MKRFCFIVFLALLAGCAPWARTNGYFHNGPARYSVDLPWGWMKHRGADVVLTRDGIMLENIVIARRNIDKKLSYTKKKFVEGMLPEEIAEVILDDLNLDKNVGNLEVSENNPVDISGKKGFKLVYSFTTDAGLKKKRVHYGFGWEKWVYEISYTAAAWHYFDAGLGAFTEVINSFKFSG